MPLIMLIFTFIFPILSIPLNFILTIISRKEKKYFMMNNAVALAFFAYNWIPPENYDLHVWQLNCSMLANLQFINAIKYILINGEPLNNLIKYIIGLTGNFGLLQFTIVLISYLIINKILLIYEEKFKLSNFSFSLIYLFTLLVLIYVNFISGLFFNFAAIIFTLGVIEFYDNKYKTGIFLIVISALLHSGMFFPICIFLILILNKSKLSLKPIIITIVFVLSLSYIIPFLLSNINIPIFSELSIMYKGYFLQNTYNSLNSGITYFLNLLKLLPLVFILIFAKNKYFYIEALGILIFVSSFLVSIKSPIFSRYFYMCCLMVLPKYGTYIDDKAQENRRKSLNKCVFIMLLTLICLISGIYQIKLLLNIDFISIIKNTILRPVIYILMNFN